jgi:hypothetical protein
MKSDRAKNVTHKVIAWERANKPKWDYIMKPNFPKHRPGPHGTVAVLPVANWRVAAAAKKANCGIHYGDPRKF